MSAPVSTLIDELLDRIPLPSTGSNAAANRVQCLRFLNNREKWTSQQGSFLYLSQRTTLTLASAAITAPAPTNPQYDPLKAAAISDDLGELTHYPVGEFDTRPLPTAYMTRTTQPTSWTLAMSGGVLTIFFDRANTTGGNLVFNHTYQRTTLDLADTGSSFSLLPDGYEKTILLTGAEIDLKGVLRIPVPQRKLDEYDLVLKAFFGAQLTEKPEASDLG